MLKNNYLILVNYLFYFLNYLFYGLHVKDNIIVLYVYKDNILVLINFLKNLQIMKFDFLLDLWVVDYPYKEKRFELNYMLLSIKNGYRLIIKIWLDYCEWMFTLTKFYKSVGWLEREMYDMFGIFFMGNNDLRRILTDYGFKNYPLLKSFPLMGYIEIIYNDSLKYLIFQLVGLSQEFRLFNFKTL